MQKSSAECLSAPSKLHLQYLNRSMTDFVFYKLL